MANDATREVFRRYGDRPEILGHLAAADCLFEHLLDLFTDDTDLVCRIAEAFVGRCAAELISMSGRAFMATPHLIDLSIRLQRLTEFRARGLALFESLLDLGVNEAVQTLRQNDHRLGAGGKRLPRRRRAAESDEDVEDETE